MSDSYQSLIPLIRKKSAITDPEKFQNLVNVIFHDFESKHYDELHSEMWESLPQQYQLLADDIAPQLQNRSGLKLLDIGCGTGLATEMLLKTGTGAHITEVHLLDTSAKMLNLALKRAASWGKKVKTINGDISGVDDRYDVIIISSVLHHIPDLAGFLAKVSELQSPGGLFITIHDPNSGSLESEAYINRSEEYRQHAAASGAKKPELGKRIVNKLKRVLKVPTYIDQVNKELLRGHIINEPLSEVELWSITDIHVEGLPYSTGKGISKELLTGSLPQYSLASYRTYAFFGLLYSNLDDVYKKKETGLSANNDPYGRNFGSVWVKNNGN